MSLRINNQTSYQAIKNQNVSFGDTLCIIKPELYEDRDNIINNFIEPAGYEVVKRWEGIPSRSRVELHYDEHRGRDYFDPIVDHLSSKNICVLRLRGDQDDVAKFRRFAIDVLRQLFAPNQKRYNGIHASDSPESAERELEIWEPVFSKNKEKAVLDTQA